MDGSFKKLPYYQRNFPIMTLLLFDGQPISIADLRQILKAAPNLTDLEITLFTLFDEMDDEEDRDASHLEFLALFPKLERLNLKSQGHLLG